MVRYDGERYGEVRCGKVFYKGYEMIKQLKIKNYKSHKDTTLDFHPGVNVFTGESQAGKTDIMRAFLWLVHNRPLGFRFKSWWVGKKDRVEVEAKFSGNVEVKKKKTKAKSSYGMTRGKEEFEYEKFGDAVPDEIEKAINISELNLQTQLDQFFLIDATPQEVARTINRVIKTEEVDEVWIPKLNKKINTIRQEISHIESELETANAKLEKYDALPSMDRLLRRIETVAKRTESLTEQENKLLAASAVMIATEKRIKEIDEYLECEDIVKSAEELVDTMVDNVRLAEGLEHYARLDDKIYECDQIIALTEIVVEAEDEAKRLDNIDHELVELADCASRVSTITEEYDEAEEYYEEKISEFEALLKKAKVCPFCTSEIGPKEIKKIIEG